MKVLSRVYLSVACISLFLVICMPSPLYADGMVSLRPGGIRVSKPVTSFQELRQRKLVRQGWDISCGAAALSTLLRYHHNDDVSEGTIVVSILNNTDPKRVRERGGFSLLDLKRFVKAVGYEGKGYGELTLQDVIDFRVPAIVPVRIRNYDHFVVFRGIAGGRVLIGDPAFGNLTMTAKRFEKIWPSGIGFIVTKKGVPAQDLTPLSPEALDMIVPNMNYVSRFVGRGSVVPKTRRPPAPLQ
jgi:predicted double-glycine peptidase